MTVVETSKFELTTVAPVYGKNYNKGCIGFTYNNSSVVSRGIAYFTKWARMSDIRVTHVLIVTGENSCIEADAFHNTVKEGTLQHYFDEPHCQIFFRKPQELTDEIAEKIVQVLTPEVGKQYDFNLIYIQALSGSFAGHLYDRLVREKLEDKLSEKLNNPEKWICSELAAYALDEQPKYKDQGILKRPNATISPQELFEDSVIFEPWKMGNLHNFITKIK
ncbi:MAG: hypothetical protein HC941_13680 [Microcoleus sp. SU_5_3]|nr:hypothetical protein [Microcoleus sp. SU_5_3]